MTNLDSTGRDRQFKDETGNRYGTLRVLHEVPNVKNAMWRVECDCGYVFDIIGIALRKRKTCRKCRATRHGMTYSPEYLTHKGMKQRCFVPTAQYYANYGGRGITVCKHWMLFDNFYEDMGRRPSDAHSIDRIDNDGHYSCGHCEECLANNWTMNCRWATQAEQMAHTSQTRLITHLGKTKHVKEWAEELGINCNSIYGRLFRGETDPVKLLRRPRPPETLCTLDGRTQSVSAWAREIGVSVSTLHGRLRAGQTLADALYNPVDHRCKHAKTTVSTAQYLTSSH